MQVDYCVGQFGMSVDYFGYFMWVDGDVQIVVQGYFFEFGSQLGVVLGGKECCVYFEYFGDVQQYGYGQWLDVVFDLVQIVW